MLEHVNKRPTRMLVWRVFIVGVMRIDLFAVTKLACRIGAT